MTAGLQKSLQISTEFECERHEVKKLQLQLISTYGKLESFQLESEKK